MKPHALALLLLAATAPVASHAQPPAALPEKSQPAIVVEGAVNRPGQIRFVQDHGLTLIEAIARAGGHTRNADLKRVWLIRLVDGKEEKTVIDVNALLRSGVSDSWPLKNGDRIVVIGRDMDE